MSLRIALGNLIDQATVSAGTTTNRVLQSDAFESANWNKAGGLTATATSAVTAPDGTTTARLLSEGTASDQPNMTQNVAGATAGARVTYSIHARVAPGAFRYLQLTYSGTAFPTVAGGIFDLTTGTPVRITDSTTVIRALDLGGGWWRIVVTAVAQASGAATLQLRIRDANTSTWGGSGVMYLGDGASGFYVWRAQQETGSIGTAPIATTTATVTGGGFQATLPVTNLQIEGRVRVARTVGLSGSAVVLGDLAASSQVSCVALYGFNLGATGWWGVELFSGTGQSGTLVYSSAEVRALPVAASGPALSVVYFPVVTARSFRLVFWDPFNAAGYVQATRILLGNYIEPAWGADYGIQLGWQDTSQQRRTLGGSLRTDSRALYRRMAFELGLLKETERAAVLDGARSVGLRSEVLVSLFPGEGGTKERDHQLLGKLTSLPQPSIDGLLSYSAQMVVEEV